MNIVLHFNELVVEQAKKVDDKNKSFLRTRKEFLLTMVDERDEKLEERLKSFILQDFISGKSPYYIGDSSDLSPKDIRIISYSEHKPEKCIEFFNTLSEVKPVLDYSIKGVKDLQEYLSNVEYIRELDLNIDRDIEFQLPKEEEDFSIPLLEGFHAIKPRKIVVKPVKRYGLVRDVNAEIIFKDFKLNVDNYKIVEPLIRLNRVYFLEKLDKDEIERLPEDADKLGILLSKYLGHIQIPPIIFNVDLMKDSINRYSNLAYLILLNQLEPLTSTHFFINVMKSIEDEGLISTNDFNKLANEKLYEEYLFGEAIVRSWLYKKGLGLGYVAVDGIEGASKKDGVDIFKQVNETGPEEVIDYYASDDWNLEKFLDGSWRAEI